MFGAALPQVLTLGATETSPVVNQERLVRDPVAALRDAVTRLEARVLQHSSVSLNNCSGPNVILVAGDQHTTDTPVGAQGQRLAQNLSGVVLTPKSRSNGVAKVTVVVQQVLGEPVTDRHSSADDRAFILPIIVSANLSEREVCGQPPCWQVRPPRAVA